MWPFTKKPQSPKKPEPILLVIPEEQQERFLYLYDEMNQLKTKVAEWRFWREVNKIVVTSKQLNGPEWKGSISMKIKWNMYYPQIEITKD